MQKVLFKVPAMYADHHVLGARQALVGQGGVAQVLASAMRRQVQVEYDEGVTSPKKIAQALVEAGYIPDQQTDLPPVHKQSEDGSTWYSVIPRVTKTEIKDLEMSGDFRRY